VLYHYAGEDKMSVRLLILSDNPATA